MDKSKQAPAFDCDRSLLDRDSWGKAFPSLRKAAGLAWRNYTHHPFVEGLGDGTLPREKFLHYLKQDYIYLIHYARAWALGVVKAECPSEMKACAETINVLVNHELQLHVQTCAREGIGEEDILAGDEENANLAYTRYVLEAGFSGDYLELLAALAPCVFGYGEIGLRLSREASSDNYKEWIGAYAEDEYQEVCRKVGKAFDQSLIRRLGTDYQKSPRWQRLQQRFTKATVLEVGFWQMGWNYQG